MKGNTNTAPHHHAIDQGDIGLGKAKHQRIQAIFLLIKGNGKLLIRILLLFVQEADIAA